MVMLDFVLALVLSFMSLGIFLSYSSLRHVHIRKLNVLDVYVIGVTSFLTK